jgi:hypothetical protein
VAWAPDHGLLGCCRGACAPAKVQWPPMLLLRNRVPQREGRGGRHPVAHQLRVVATQHVLEPLGGVHPLQPLLGVELFLEVRGEELVSFQSPAHGNSCLNQFQLSKQVTHDLANLNPKHMVENGHLDAMMRKMKKAVSLMANPRIFFSTSKPTSKSRRSTSSP